ncbi:MAG: DUF2933 domain-containing protein [Polaromonas sp.]|uniref:DUF2933 domain-containing protein n=1 Tax=Polaromonas sp. TaxID=1869339 RepID=UPI0025FF2086|nr:DUF2933 domain-containing protein [Polaromonas sp.]MBI2725832.1 DUF2933 domain-containing protein [Polaromonas sp.]
MNHDHQHHEPPPPFWGSRYSLGLLVIGAVAGYFLLKEHLVHVATALPYLFVLACPVMHIFMHRGHGHKHGSSRQDNVGPGSGNKGDAP